MSDILVPSGAPLPLSLQLFDGATNQYPLAYVVDKATLAPVASVPLSHVANGLYCTNSYIAPDGQYYATYVVYSNSGHSLENVNHTREEDYFDVNPLFAEVAEIGADVDNIESIVGTIAINTNPSSIATAVWDANKSAHDTPQTFGYTNSGDLTGPRAILLDNLAYLDIPVSSRASEADMLSGFNLGAKDATVAKQALLNSVYTLLGTPENGTISADIAEIDVDTDAIESLISAGGVNISATSLIALVNAIWNEQTNLHTQSGSTGLAITSGGGGGGIVTPSDVAAIASAVWNEPMGGHLLANTSGAYENIIPAIKSGVDLINSNYTPARATKLDNLDAAISTRASTATVNALSAIELTAIAAIQATDNAINTLVQTINVKLGTPANGTIAADLAEIEDHTDVIEAKTQNLPTDPASQSLLDAQLAAIHTDTIIASVDAAAIKLKTDNLPSDPARQSSVLAIPTNPLLAIDPRLLRLDVAVSTRAKPADLLNLATTSGLAALQAAIEADLATVMGALIPLATSAELTAAVAPLSTQILLQATKTAVDNLALNALSASQVWNYTPRTLTGPVHTDLDISGLATAVQLAATQAAIVAAIPKTECQIAVSIDPDLDVLTAEAWMIRDGTPLTDRTSCTVDVYDATGALAFSVGPVGSPSSVGVFELVRNGVSGFISRNKAYVAKISITKGVDTKVSLKSFTVF